MNAMSRAMTSPAACSRSARKNTERLSIDEMLQPVRKADNVIHATHTTRKMLEPSADEIRNWGNSVTQFMVDYLGELRDRPAYRHMSSREIRSGLESKLPIKGTDFDSLLKVFREAIVPFSRQNAHPR